MEKPIKIDDLGVPLFLETPIYTCQVYFQILDDDSLGVLSGPIPNIPGWFSTSNICGLQICTMSIPRI